MTEPKAIATIAPATPVRLEFTADQRQMIRDSIANGMDEPAFAVFIEVARSRNLNPLHRQITPISRFDKRKNRSLWTYQVTIDGLRCIAERTGRYEGQTPVMWCGPDGKWVDVWLESEPPAAAKVGVYKQGFREPLIAIARWDSYAVTGDGGFMWSKMPDLMIAKCAEALALRKAFPEDMSGLYTEEEMAQSRSEHVAVEVAGDNLQEKLDAGLKLIQDKKNAGALKPAGAKVAAEILDGEIVDDPPPKKTGGKVMEIKWGDYAGLRIDDPKVPTPELIGLLAGVERSLKNPAKKAYEKSNLWQKGQLEAEIGRRTK